ncbi:HD-GYP domain-containing protein [Heliobacterium mobile]|nr:HD domain-containing phosphohydrolase [Heliobacterium mobile]
MLPVETLKVIPGLTLGQTLYTPDGRVLLVEGVKLTETTIRRIQSLNLPFIYVEDPVIGSLPLPRAVPEKMRVDSVFFLHQQFEQVQKKKGTLDIRQLDTLASSIVNEVQGYHSPVHHMDVRLPETYLAAHTFNVAVLAIRTAIALGIKPMRLKDFALGALLHDIGYLFIPDLELRHRDPLSPGQRHLVETHPENGFEWIRKNGFLNITVAHCAFQHHERWDGNGYPRRLKGDEIHEFAQILSVVDVYDALTNERPYRSRMQPCQALKQIHALSGICFNPRVVTALSDNIAVYPIGSRIQFPDGKVGVVVDTEASYPFRPKIRLLPPLQEQECLPTMLAVDLDSKDILLTDMQYVS